MSSMEIYGVKPDGEIVSKVDLKNSWLGAALVWTQLGEKYYGKYDYVAAIEDRERRRKAGETIEEEFDPSGWTRTWKLQNDPRITDAEWCVLLSTFDNFILPREHFEYAAKCFEEFHKAFPNSHYARCAEVIRELDAEGFIGYCVNATSVNQNPWWVPLEDDEGRSYNINQDTKHWFFDPKERAERLKKNG